MCDQFFFKTPDWLGWIRNSFKFRSCRRVLYQLSKAVQWPFQGKEGGDWRDVLLAMCRRGLQNLHPLYDYIRSLYPVYIVTTRTGALGRRLSNHKVFWKQKILKFFCKQTNKIQGSTMPVENYRTVWTCLTSQEKALKFMNVIGPFAKNLRIFCFQKKLWLDNLPSAPVRAVAL